MNVGRQILSIVGVPVVINKMDPHLLHQVQGHLPFRNFKYPWFLHLQRVFEFAPAGIAQ